MLVHTGGLAGRGNLMTFRFGRTFPCIQVAHIRRPFRLDQRIATSIRHAMPQIATPSRARLELRSGRDVRLEGQRLPIRDSRPDQLRSVIVEGRQQWYSLPGTGGRNSVQMWDWSDVGCLIEQEQHRRIERAPSIAVRSYVKFSSSWMSIENTCRGRSCSCSGAQG
jgi:hypothetical protein